MKDEAGIDGLDEGGGETSDDDEAVFRDGYFKLFGSVNMKDAAKNSYSGKYYFGNE